MPKVKEMMKLMLMPISEAADGLKATARIAMPSLVFKTRKRKAASSTSVTTTTTICVLLKTRPPMPMFWSGSSFGNARGAAPKTALCWQVYSMNRETPMAVIRTVRRGRSRKGR